MCSLVKQIYLSYCCQPNALDLQKKSRLEKASLFIVALLNDPQPPPRGGAGEGGPAPVHSFWGEDV